MDDKQFTYLNRDLSWLSFNHRVLLEAADETVPLYSRISFLSIFSSNLDEFFRVRMPSIYAFTNIKAKKTPLRDEYPKELVKQVTEMLSEQLEQYGQVLTRQILPALKENHIHLYYGDPIMSAHQDTIREYFLSKVLSFLQPVFLNKENQSEIFLKNNSLYFIVNLASTGHPGVALYAVLNIPSANLPRFLELPPIDDTHYILFLDDVVREVLSEAFPGYIIQGAWSVKLTRDAELNLEDEFAGDLAEKIEKQLEKRDAGHSTRLLYEHSMPDPVKDFVTDYFGLRDEELMPGGRYHNLKDLADLPNPSKDKLSYPSWPALPHPGFSQHNSIFQSITENEKLLHLPYHSYNYILRFFNEAAIDPHVKEIYATVYRVAAESHILHALISAAKNGKKVTVFVELKARFDEANNLNWSKKMKAAGIKIINSIPGLKVHAKVALVKRMENKQLQLYSLMSTGNLNEATGRFYTDHVFFTAHKDLSAELECLFEYLQSRTQPGDYRKIPFKQLLVSQFNMIKQFNELIEREIKNAKEGKPAGIIIKLNNLQEREMIARLYEASRAGVKVQLLVRSICCVAAGVTGQSENITVTRIVDRYLEHARIFVFHNGGAPEYYMGSADWMNRNLHSRIEVCFPVNDPQLTEQINHILQFQLNDTGKAVLFNNEYKNIKPSILRDGTAAQETTYKYIQSL